MIEFPCERCGRPLEFPDERAGKKGQCRACGAVVTIAGPGAERAAPAAAQPPVPPPPPPTPPALPPLPWPSPPAATQRTRTLAVCTLAFGVLAIIPFAGWAFAPAALVVGIVSLATNRPGRPIAITGLALTLVFWIAGVFLTFWLVSPPWFRDLRTFRDLAACQRNLEQIGIAVTFHAGANDGALPESLQALIDEDPALTAEALKCPNADTDRDCDYVYHVKAGARVTDFQDPAAAILACDREGNHGSDRNVLFVDGRVATMSEEDFQAVLRTEDNAEFARHLDRVEGE